MKYVPIPSQEVLRQILDYNPYTGVLVWHQRPGMKSFNSKHAGKEAFTSISCGYKQGLILGKKYLAHRVIWKWMTDEDPSEIDHIDGDRTNNRWSNLGLVTRLENTRNTGRKTSNTSGYTGVFWEKSCSKWRAQIRINGKSIHIGVFDQIQDAVLARKQAESDYGFHHNHGNRRLK